MKQIRRRTTRAIMVPFALFVIVLGGTLPASAAPLKPAPEASNHVVLGHDSLSW